MSKGRKKRITVQAINKDPRRAYDFSVCFKLQFVPLNEKI